MVPDYTLGWLYGDIYFSYGQSPTTIPLGLFGDSVSNGYERYPSTRIGRIIDDLESTMAEAAADNPRSWVRDCAPPIPKRLGLKRYRYRAPGARVRLTRTQFAII